VVLIVILPFVGLPHVSLSICSGEERAADGADETIRSESATNDGEIAHEAGDDESAAETDEEQAEGQDSLLDSFLSGLMRDDNGAQSEEGSAESEADGDASGVPPFGEFLNALLAEFADAGARLFSDAERETLTIYGELSDAELAERIAGLLDEADVDRIQSQLRDLKARADETEQLLTADPTADEPEQAEGTSLGSAGSTPDAGELATPLATGQGTPSENEEGTGSANTQPETDATSPDELEDASGQPSVIGDIVEGYGNEPPDVVEAEIVGSVGDEGTISEYITAGVPIEYGNGRVAETQTFDVDYERAEAILTARSIPQNAREIVRDYFELISEGDR